MRALEWRDLEQLEELPSTEFAGWVEARLGDVLVDLTPADGLVIAKSLGSCAAAAVATAGLPAIWVTPLLRDEAVVAGLRRATAPFLLVGGTADEWWDSELAHELTPHVLEIPDADHGLFLPGPLAASVDNLARLATAAEQFLDGVVWAGRQTF